jgi:hypothetical protein
MCKERNLLDLKMMTVEALYVSKNWMITKISTIILCRIYFVYLKSINISTGRTIETILQ